MVHGTLYTDVPCKYMLNIARSSFCAHASRMCVPHRAFVVACVCVTQVAAREHIHLARQLSQLTNLKRVETVDLLTSMFAMDTPSKDPSLLRAALLVARALPCEAGCITVEGWYATEAVVAELRGLPPWRHVSLELMTENQDTEVTECYWPLARAALLIPRCVLVPRTCTHTHIHKTLQVHLMQASCRHNRSRDLTGGILFLCVRPCAYLDGYIFLRTRMQEHAHLPKVLPFFARYRTS